jgi:hypothetical protein
MKAVLFDSIPMTVRDVLMPLAMAKGSPPIAGTANVPSVLRMKLVNTVGVAASDEKPTRSPLLLRPFTVVPPPWFPAVERGEVVNRACDCRGGKAEGDRG